jgi:6-phosphofructokinase 2
MSHGSGIVVTLTMNPSVDESTEVEHVVSEIKLRCGPLRAEPGGGGINVARVLRRFRRDPVAIYACGGLTGQRLRELVEAEGVRDAPVAIAGATRRNLNVSEKASGRQYRFVMPGPVLAEDEWRRCLDAVRGFEPAPEFVVASGSLPPGAPTDFFARVALVAREHGSKFLLDTSGDPLRLALEAGVFLVKPSLREFQELVGEATYEHPRVVELARRRIAQGCSEAMVVSLGAAGALWVTADADERVPAPAVPVVSTAGAGDAMVGGILDRLLDGASIGDAVRFGVAAGSAAVTSPGTSLCRREDAERLCREILSIMATPAPAS